MHADSAFAIGSAHGVCEDYARAGVDPSGRPYAIVCDGCSGSPDTDVGARVLALAAERILQVRLELTGQLIRDIADSMRPFPDDLSKPNALDATVLVVHVDDERPRIDLWGDGTAGYLRDGVLRGTQIRAKEGMPPYLSYGWSEDRLRGYLELVGARDNREAWTLDGFLGQQVGVGVEPYIVYPTHDAEVVAVFSDGVESFRDSSGMEIKAGRIIQELMSFKTLRGCFVTRRFYAFLRDCKARGWTHSDDLAMAAVCLVEDHG